ncbi:MAG: ABC transporter substrate-binding protein [Candidatus Niameybacter stercoravium]|nr:ABC transporter substrate-binding protein [Candidatus Niameybacter stercoravium]
MKIKKLLVLGLSAAMAMSVMAGCSTSKQSPESEQKTQTPKQEEKTEEKVEEKAEEKKEGETEIVIPVVSKGFQHQFWQAVKMGAEQAAEELGVSITFEGPETEDQIDKQLEMLQAALAKNPQAVCLAALDSKAATPYLEQADAAGIPVIGFDSGVDSPIVKTTCATDNYVAAAAAAHKMAELIGGEGKVGLVVHGQTSQSAKDRRDGFMDTMKNKYPNITVLEPQYGDGDHAKSTEAAKAIITANPDVKGIYGANEGSAAGVINAVKELNQVGKITVVGFDSGKIMIDAINSGVAAGSITQDPVGIGYKAVEAAYKAYKGEENPEFIDTGFKWFDKTNIDTPEIQAVIYE